MPDATVPGVYAKIAKVMDEVARIPKNGRNEFHKYDYVTEADLVDAIRPKMAKIGLVMLSSQGERNEVQMQTRSGVAVVARIRHTFTFVDTADGSQHAIDVWGEGHDNLDKASYKAFTGAVKYALMKTFLVATGDDPEMDSGTTSVQPIAGISTAQKEEIESLMSQKVELLTDIEREKVEAVFDHGTFDEATKAITFLRRKGEAKAKQLADELTEGKAKKAAKK